MKILSNIQLTGKGNRQRKLRGASWLLCTLLLAGCASNRAFRAGNSLFAEGKTQEGLAKLEEAVKLDPRNVEYRIALMSRRASVINVLMAAADAHLQAGRVGDAESGYRRVLELEPQHAMAQQGMRGVQAQVRHSKQLGEVRALLKEGSDGNLADAQERLRSVLLENADHAEARELQQRIDQLRAKTSKEEVRLAATYRKPITLEFRDAPVRAVFDVIAQVSGLRFFFDQDVRQDLRTTILAKDTSIEDAIRLILVTSQLEQKVLSDNTVLIYPNIAQKLRDYQTLVVRSFYISNADVKSVASSLKTITKVRDMAVDERLGLIIVRDTPEAIRVAERIVAMQDLGDPEVMLDVEVMEIKRSRLLELGIQWPSQVTLSPIPAGSALTLRELRHLNAGVIQASVGNVAINARKEDQDANTLANPRIRVRNKEKAKILIGDRVPVISNTSTATGFVSESISYLDVGLKLEVEPVVHQDDEVGIRVNLEVSTLIKEILSKSGALSYQIGTRGASTVLRLKNGETQILAGLINDEDRSSANKVPVVGELPVLGRLFGSQKDDGQRSEILLSITPRILRSLQRPDMLRAEFESGTEARMGAPSLTLSSVQPPAVPALPAGPTASTRQTTPVPPAKP